MSNLSSPKITVTFAEAAVATISRANLSKVVALIVRDAAEVVPTVLTRASEIPAALSAENKAYVSRAFLGYVNAPKKVILYVLAADGDIQDALDYMSTQDFDYLAGPADCSAEDAAAIAAWIKAQRSELGAKYKAVLPNTAADNPGVVNFTAGGLTDGTKVYAAAQYCSRVAGLLAGTPMDISATYAPMPELTDITRMTRDERDEAVGKGELLAIWDGRKVKLDRAVTSLVTTTETTGADFKKIKLVEIMDMIRTDITKTAEDSYIGKYANTYDNKMLLVTAIRAYFAELAGERLVQEGYSVDIDVDAQGNWLKSKNTDIASMTDQEIRHADTDTHVFLCIAVKLLDAVEDITIAIAI